VGVATTPNGDCAVGEDSTGFLTGLAGAAFSRASLNSSTSLSVTPGGNVGRSEICQPFKHPNISKRIMKHIINKTITSK